MKTRDKIFGGLYTDKSLEEHDQLMDESLAKIKSVLSTVEKKHLTSIIFEQLFYKYFINKISNY
jgi:hypothetical protein